LVKGNSAQQPLYAIAEFFLLEKFISRRLFYLGRENSARFHPQLTQSGDTLGDSFVRRVKTNK